MATVLGKTNYWEDKILKLLKATNITAPATVYLAAYTTLPNEDGTGGTEVSGNAYARQAITFGSVSVLTEGSKVANSVAISFPVATPSGWGTIVGVGVCDALTTGNILYAGAMVSPQTIAAGNQLGFAIGKLEIEEH